jgi:hypothetical protein
MPKCTPTPHNNKVKFKKYKTKETKLNKQKTRVNASEVFINIYN